MIDGATAVRWAILAVALPLLWSRPRLTIGHALGATWLLFATISVAWSPDRWNAVQHLIYLAMGGLAFSLGGEAASLRAFGRGAALGLGVSSAVAVAQVLGWQGVWQGASPAGLFYNKNFMAEAMVLCTTLCLMYKDWPYVIALVPGIVLAHCRSADGALILAGVVALWQARRYALAVALATCAAAFAATLNPETLDLRFTMWGAALGHLAFFGHGLGSFYTQYPSFGPLLEGSRPEYPHNELIYAIYELGIGAIAPLALGIWCWLGGKAERPILAAATFVAAFGFPLQLPFTLCVISLVAGRCAYSRRSLRYITTKWGTLVYGRTSSATA